MYYSAGRMPQFLTSRRTLKVREMIGRQLGLVDLVCLSHAHAMWIANFKIAAQLRAALVVLTLLRFHIQPDAGFANVDIGQTVDVVVDLLFEAVWQANPVWIVAVTVELWVAESHTAGPATFAIEDGKLFQRELLRCEG